MIVLDAYAVIAYLRGEPAADEVAGLLRKPTRLSAVNVAEVIDQMVRVAGHDYDDVEVHLAMMEHSRMEIVVATDAIALEAGRLRAAYYDKKLRAVSMADCFAAATSLSADAALATSDPHLASMMLAERGKVCPLPDRRGRRPEPS